MIGFVNIDKPPKVSSSFVVSKVRRILGVKTAGHMGTLDPQGVGVLPVAVGKATRLFDYLLGKDKEYEAEFTFGYETDTLDGEGVTVAEGGRVPDAKELEQALPALCGKVSQLPPKYSAKSVDGRKAYELARQGVEFELKKAEVEIFSLRLVKRTGPKSFLFNIHCSSGTYMRSICRDLAYALKTYAVMTSIRRLRSGCFAIGDSITLDELAQKGEQALVGVEYVLQSLPRIELGDEYYEELCFGRKIEFSCPHESFALYCKNELFGLAKIIDGVIKISAYLRE